MNLVLTDITQEKETRKVIFIPVADVLVTDRARKEFTAEGLVKLTDAIRTNIGLLHPIIILKDNTLLTGERRLRVITQLHETGDSIKFVGEEIPLNTIPAIRVDSTFDALDLLIAEDVENSAREAFSWQEQARLVANIARLKQLKMNQAAELAEEGEEDDEDSPTKATGAINSLMRLMSNPDKLRITSEAAKAVSMELHGRADGGYLQQVTTNLRLNEALQDPVMAEKLNKAPTRKEAAKIMEREEMRVVQGRIAHAQGASLRGERHTLINGDCLEELRKLPDASINICLTDPIYGINAHKFGIDQTNRTVHEYDDTPEEFEKLLPEAIKEVSRILKEQAHMYLFCDLTKFYQIKAWVEEHGTKSNPWTVQSYPLLYLKINNCRIPHPGFTWRKNAEYILFAYRGGKQSNHQMNSYFEVSMKRGETHGAAKCPEALKILLNNSTFPGDSVLDFMAGAGSTIVACDELKLRCTAIELDKSHYGRMIERTKALQK